MFDWSFYSITKVKFSFISKKIVFKKEKRKKKRTFLWELTFDFPSSNKSWTIWWYPLKAAASSAVAPYFLGKKMGGKRMKNEELINFVLEIWVQSILHFQQIKI